MKLSSIVLIATGALIAGTALGRWTAPGSKTFARAADEAVSSRSPLGSSSLENAPDRSRALADVTPGDTARGRQKRILTLSELLHSTDYMKNFREGDRLAETLDRDGLLQALAQVEAAADGGNAKMMLQSVFLNRLAEIDPLAAVNYSDALKDPRKFYFYSNIATSWAAHDPKAARAWAMQLKDKRQKNAAMQGIIAAMAESNPDQALQMALSLSNNLNGGDSGNFAYTIFQAMASRDPASAAQKAVGLANVRLRQQAINVVARQWAEKDPAAAARWAETLSNRLQSNALGNIISSWARQDPLAAAAYAAALPLGKRGNRNGIFSNLASNWAQQDTAAALHWAESLPPEQGGQEAMQAGISTWAQSDPQAAAEYIAKLSPGTFPPNTASNSPNR